ncbi:hypothetical protein GF362_02860 [Candidatus Dojkabacteria bacterium]|nr:hypothetical protein [Candidatus Dojkabacteria bacterium]
MNFIKNKKFRNIFLLIFLFVLISIAVILLFVFVKYKDQEDRRSFQAERYSIEIDDSSINPSIKIERGGTSLEFEFISEEIESNSGQSQVKGVSIDKEKISKTDIPSQGITFFNIHKKDKRKFRKKITDSLEVLYTLTDTQIKEEFVLSEPKDIDHLKFKINLEGLDARKGYDGIWRFYNENGTETFYIPKSFMKDANDVHTENVSIDIVDNMMVMNLDKGWLLSSERKYPVLIDPTIVLSILTVHSHPQTGDDWIVDFKTEGTADLTITPDDQATIDDIDFLTLSCGKEERTPQILENDVIFYKNWNCEDTAKVFHYVNTAAPHRLKFQFGQEVDYAYNSPNSTIYAFSGLSTSIQDRFAYEKYPDSFTGPTDTGVSEATASAYTSLEADDGSRWVTDGASNNGEIDAQLYKFIIEEQEASITDLNIKWNGFGDTSGGDTELSIWNWNLNQWTQLDSYQFNNSTDLDLIGSISGGFSSIDPYVSSQNEVILMVHSKKTFVCGEDILYGGQYYNTVQIGNQCWMAENLNITDGNEDGNCTFTSDCYISSSTDTDNCSTFGGLYYWDEARCGETACNGTGKTQPECTNPVQGICPDGWHIPSHYEWNALEQQVCSDIGNTNCNTEFPYDETTTNYRGQSSSDAHGEASALAGGCSLWNNDVLDNYGSCNNDFGTTGLNLLPGGMYSFGSYHEKNRAGYYLSSTEKDSTYIWHRMFHYAYTQTYRQPVNKSNVNFSIRCIKD